MSEETDVLESLRVQILSAEPGDIVVLTTDLPMTLERAQAIKKAFLDLVPDRVSVAVMPQIHVDSVIRPG